MHRSDVTFDFSKGGSVTVHNHVSEPWKVTVIDTGYGTMTGGRVKRIAGYVGNETFLLTYGDGVADIRIDEVLRFHKKHKKIVTITTVNPGQRFGVLDVNESGLVTEFHEKRESDGYLINGGFMVAEPELFDYIDGDQTFLEKEPLERLAREEKLVAYKHDGFWQCMDTQRDKEKLEMLWDAGQAPWKIWN